ncbi:MAG: pantoate--beta-alanine ligase [bacterium]|nr:pantoate--beta-alanine ligase [bacterium]
MQVIKEIQTLRQWIGPAGPQDLGLVPTMGYLHEGHISLVKRALSENRRVAVSIFVNPAQFNDPADLEKYPRNEAGDLELLRQAGVGAVFLPSPEVIYPPEFNALVRVERLTAPLEGASRPGHFDGVTTVVAKLFNLFTPCRAYFGEKDAQQLLVIQKMVADLNFPVKVVACPTQREADGLAMSSRNARLTPDQRAEAPLLYRALLHAEKRVAEGLKETPQLLKEMTQIIESGPLAVVDYISFNDPKTLEPVEQINGEVLVSLAVFFGALRLIDNIRLQGGA